MAISAGDFRTGLTLIVDGDPWQVLDFQHVKPGKGAAILKTKMKNLKTGNTQERNFNASTKFEQANISKKSAQFSYEADATYYFMDMETFDTYELSEDQIGFNKYFIVEGSEVSLIFFEGLLLSVSIHHCRNRCADQGGAFQSDEGCSHRDRSVLARSAVHRPW